MSETVPSRRVSEPPLAAASQLPPLDFQPRELEEGGGDWLRYLWGFWEHKWLIGSILALSLLAGLAQYWGTPPTYAADALLQLEKGESALSALKPFEQYGEILGDSVSVAAEVEIMKSRTIMSAVADKLKLDIQASPVYFPYIGEPIARRYRGDGVAKPWFDKAQYAWGGEEIELQSFVLPQASEGRGFLLLAGEAGQYTLYDDEGRQVLQGTTGTRAEGRLADGEGVALFVSRLKARPGTQFQLLRAPLERVATGLSAGFSASEQPKLSGIVRVRQLGSRKGAEAEQTLVFVEKQLPALKERLDAAEAAYNSYLREHGSVDVTQETNNVLKAIVEAESEVFNLQQEREKLRERFKPTHPKIQSLDGLIEQLQAKLKGLEANTKTLPELQQTVLKLSRDVQVNTGLYSQLINSLQELRIAKAGTVGNARIIDQALPATVPTSPVLRSTLAIHGFVGLLLGLGIIFLRLKLRRGVEDPSEIERELGLSVFATIPFSEAQEKISKRSKKKASIGTPLALAAPQDQAIESIRGLRTSLHFLLLDSPNNVLLVTGPSQGVGKSFLSVNLAVVLAQAGRRVLLVDADMRKGHIHKLLGLEPGVGLSEYVAGTAPGDAVVAAVESAGIDFVSTGERPPNPSELLMHDRFGELIQWGGRTHDFVIVDAPPVLAVTDAAIIGRHAGAATATVTDTDTATETTRPPNAEGRFKTNRYTPRSNWRSLTRRSQDGCAGRDHASDRSARRGPYDRRPSSRQGAGAQCQGGQAGRRYRVC